ncbi:sugar transferase [bacterium]|nr:sugar transferase [candidate division CSSED10-310 bacterium]
MPFVSVIIPAYNAESTISACVTALLNQTCDAGSYEVIIVDDGSTDATAAQAEKLGARVVRLEHQGPAMARNQGVAVAKGDIVLFTDADCEADPRWVELMLQPFLRDDSVTGVKGVYRTRQRSIAARFAQVEFEDRYRRLAKADSIDFVDSHAAAFRRDVFTSVGGFDPSFPVANNEDVDLSYKIAKAGHRMVFTDRAFVYHKHPEGVRDYLRTKLLRGYWRMKVYQRFPGKMVSDSYTPQSLKLEILLSGLVLVFLFLGIWRSGFLTAAAVAAGLFFLCTVPFTLFAARRDPLVALVSPMLLFARSLVFAFGVAAGILSKKRGDILIPLLLFLADLVSCIGGLVIAYYIRIMILAPLLPRFDHPLRIYLALAPFILLIWFAVFQTRNLYNPGWVRTPLSEYVKVLQCASQVALVIIACSFFIKWDFSRPMVVLFWLISSTLAIATRSIVRRVQRPMLDKGYNTIKALVVGTGDTATMVINRLSSVGMSGYRFIGLVDDTPPRAEVGRTIPYLGDLGQLVEIITRENVDEVLIANPTLSHQATLDLIARCDHTGVRFKVVSDVFNILVRGANMDEVVQLPVVDLREEGNSWVRRGLKALLDMVLGLVLAILATPLALLAAGLLRMYGRRWLRVQTMMGMNGRLFGMYRLDCDPAAAGFAGRLSRFLEHKHLDEVPQLLNVLRGEMSLVGPRPELQEIVKGYEEWQRRRLSVKPGITGLWQIYGRSDRPLHEDLEYDFYYIKNYSFILDLSILIKTLPILLVGRRKA